MPSDNAPPRPHLFVPAALATTASRFPPIDRFSHGLKEALGGDIPEASPAPDDVIKSASRIDEMAPGPAEEAEITEDTPANSVSGHSPEELDAMRQAAYRQGYDAGVDEFHKQQRDSEQQHQNAFMAALAEIDKLTADLTAREERIEQDAAALLKAAITQFYGRLDETAKERALLLCRAIEASHDAEIALRRPKGVEIYLHPDDAESFSHFIGEKDAVAALSALRECRIIASDKVGRGDAEMRWLHGGMSVSPKRIYDSVMAAFDDV